MIVTQDLGKLYKAHAAGTQKSNHNKYTQTIFRTNTVSGI